MPHASDPLTPAPIDAAEALREVTASAEAILQTLRLSRAFLCAGRTICLDGLDQLVARLCAQCLGLEQQEGASLLLHLMAVRAELDATSAVLTMRQGNTACPSMTS